VAGAARRRDRGGPPQRVLHVRPGRGQGHDAGRVRIRAPAVRGQVGVA
jgi:hypothetical protein